MRNAFIGVVITATAIIGGMYAWNTVRLGGKLFDGKAAKVVRGDLEIPVSATGEIIANEITEVKSEASGKVLRVNVVEGGYVRKGEVVIELDPDDEERNVDRAKAELERATAAHEQALIRLEENEKNRPLDVDARLAQVHAAEADMETAQIAWDLLQNVQSKSAIEIRRTQANLDRAKAAVASAQVEYERAKNLVPISVNLAKQDVKTAKAMMDAAEKSFEDAQERLNETTITAPNDGMIYSIRVREGEVIQGGSTTFTGGTPLMYIADTSSTYVEAAVDEADIGMVRKIAPDFALSGQARRVDIDELLHLDNSNPNMIVPTVADLDEALVGRGVEISLPSEPETKYTGVIERIKPEPNRASGVTTFTVRIRILGDDLKDRIGHEADVAFKVEKVHDVLLVPNEALVSELKEFFVYIPDRTKQGAAGETKIQVKIGITDGTNTQIVSDVLKENDEVWTKRPTKFDKDKDDDEDS